MKLRKQWKQAKDSISVDHLNIYGLALLNLFLLIGIGIGGNSYFNNFFITIGLIMNITAFSVVLFTEIPSIKKISKNELPIVVILATEMSLLFGIPMLPAINVPLFMPLIIVTGMQVLVSYYFWNLYEREINELTNFFALSGSAAYRYISPKLAYSYYIPKISRVKFMIILTIEKMKQLLRDGVAFAWLYATQLIPGWLLFKKPQTRSAR